MRPQTDYIKSTDNFKFTGLDGVTRTAEEYDAYKAKQAEEQAKDEAAMKSQAQAMADDHAAKSKRLAQQVQGDEIKSMKGFTFISADGTRRTWDEQEAYEAKRKADAEEYARIQAEDNALKVKALAELNQQ